MARCHSADFQQGRDTDPQARPQGRPSFFCAPEAIPVLAHLVPSSLTPTGSPLPGNLHPAADTGLSITEAFLRLSLFSAKLGPASLPHASPDSHLPKTTFKAPVAFAASSATQEVLSVSECQHGSTHETKTNLPRLYQGNRSREKGLAHKSSRMWLKSPSRFPQSQARTHTHHHCSW